MPSIKIINISRDIKVGVNTVVEFLQKKGVVEDFGPNTRVSPEDGVACVKELGKSLSQEEKDDLIRKYTSPKANRGEGATTSAELKKEHKVVPSKESFPKKEEVIKASVPEDLKPKIVSKGSIDLSDGHPSKGSSQKDAESKLVVDKVEPQKNKEEQAPVVEKKQEVQATQVTVKENPQPEKIAPEKKTEDKKVISEKPQRVEEKRPVDTPNKKEVSEKHSVEKKEKPNEAVVETSSSAASIEKKEETSVSSTTESQMPGVKILGKIDLSTIEGYSSAGQRKKKKGKDGAEADANVEKKKRKRIGKQKVDITSPENQSKETKGNQKKNASANNGGQNQKGRTDQASSNNNGKLGRKAKRAAVVAKAEVSQEEIQKQIKETLQQMQNQKRKGATAAKYRKDKREAHRREADEMERENAESKVLRLTEYVTPNDLSSMIDVPVNEIIMLCFNIGIIVSINQRLEKETIDLVLEEYGYTPEYVEAEVIDAISSDEEEREEDLVPRAPIVTVMGHVDHGKTSLLDNIRKTNVIAGEAGGITQHVGAYSVKLSDGRRITFLDTPGHEAFTAMRARGAKVTDIVIIVVAADDGVMPQTIEAINHASMAGVPIIFAINKIDKPSANPDKIKEELANLNYLVEDWGGKYQSQNISAKGNIGIDELLEKVLLEAELLDLKANPNKRAAGSVIESTLEHGRGYTTKVLVQEGTLRVGDYILSGMHYGRVKALFNERGQNVDNVGPSTPVKVLGLNGAAQAGDALNVMPSEHEAREIAAKRTQLQREQRERMHKVPTLQDLGTRIKEGNVQELNVIVKGDVDGSVEALSGSIEKLSTDTIRIRVIHKAVGQISDSDVMLAATSEGLIIGFQVRPSASAKRLAESEGVEIRTYSVIYNALDDVKAAMEGMLEPEYEENVTANLEVRETFRISKVGTIAGCIVKDGKINRHNKVRLIRDGIVLYSGELASLKRFKDDVKEVGYGYECGLNLEGYNDLLVGDIIEAYEVVEVKKKL